MCMVTMAFGIPLSMHAWCAFAMSLSKKKCFSIALGHTLVVLEMH